MTSLCDQRLEFVPEPRLRNAVRMDRMKVVAAFLANLPKPCVHWCVHKLARAPVAHHQEHQQHRITQTKGTFNSPAKVPNLPFIDLTFADAVSNGNVLFQSRLDSAPQFEGRVEQGSLVARLPKLLGASKITCGRHGRVHEAERSR